MKFLSKAIGLFILLSSLPAYAAEPPDQSLFFTDEENQKIESLAVKAAPAVSKSGDIHLGAVLYYGPDEWTIWLQNSKWTPTTPPRADLHILDVKPNEVHLSWTGDPNAAPQTIVLRPYQTYQIATGKISEGLR